MRREYKVEIVRDLFKIYNKFDANYEDKLGLTHFHVACKFNCKEAVKKFLEAGQDPNVVWRETDRSPLHLAVSYRNIEIAKILLRSGADPNQPANEYGWTPLHLAMASSDSDPQLVRVLLENGADPNLADRQGLTPLNTFCKVSSKKFRTLLALFRICEDEGLRLLVDAEDDSGQTPMYYAANQNSPILMRILLEQGADPNSTDSSGYTPLHFICRRRWNVDYGFVAVFLDTCKENDKQVLIDARDNEGLTPLQWAVVNYNPDYVDRLLDSGANLESFVFPTSRRFHEFVDRLDTGEKVKFAAGVLTVVECLEKRGYKLDRCDTMTIMRLFDVCELFEGSANLEITWGDDENFKSRAKEYLFHSGLSLYDLMDSRAEEAKRLALADYHRLARSRIFTSLHYEGPSVDACELRLCEMLSRRFFRDWALESFLVLIHYRLPILCYDMIVENLTNRDLYNICLAASRLSGINVPWRLD